MTHLKNTMPIKSRSKAAVKAPQYRAPALEKGLDVLELLVRERVPLTVSMISQRLGRSTSELFRMIMVLEYKGFIEQSGNGEGYVPSSKLFSLGMDQAPVKNLLEVALPVMRKLSASIGQSCHLAMRSESDIVVVARMESSEPLGFSVRIGYRRPMLQTASGVVLYAFQPEAIQTLWLAGIKRGATPTTSKAFVARAERVVKCGYDQAPSQFVKGVIDLSAPLLRGDSAAAALTVPFVQSRPVVTTVATAISALLDAAAEISTLLPVGDHRI